MAKNRNHSPPGRPHQPDLAPQTRGAGAAVFDAEAFATAFGVSRETLTRLKIYESALLRWQKSTNLVASATLREIWWRHFADSAQIARLIPAGAEVLVDLGSGAGFPGLVLAIMRADTPPPLRVVLVESDRRKGAFLREVARQTRTDVEILSTRIENLENLLTVQRIDVVTARAVAPLDRLFELTAPLFAAGTVGLFPKGRGAAQEIEAARERWAFDVSLVSSLTESGASIVVVGRLSARSVGDHSQL